MPRFAAQDLRAMTGSIFRAVGFPAGEAEVIARLLIEANLCGHDSHGFRNIIPYLRRIGELLKPEDERVKSFHVGSREFDPKHVGLSTDAVAGAFHFQTISEDGTPIRGNSNKGHSGDGHTNFTEDQRWAIIEYIKTLK